MRKVVGDKGGKFKLLLAQIAAEAVACTGSAGQEAMGASLGNLHARLTQETDALIADSAGDPELPHRVAGDFLRLVGLSLVGVMWARTARVASSQATSDSFYAAKIVTARFYFDYLLPEASYRLDQLQQGRQPLPWLTA